MGLLLIRFYQKELYFLQKSIFMMGLVLLYFWMTCGWMGGGGGSMSVVCRQCVYTLTDLWWVGHSAVQEWNLIGRSCNSKTDRWSLVLEPPSKGMPAIEIVKSPSHPTLLYIISEDSYNHWGGPLYNYLSQVWIGGPLWQLISHLGFLLYTPAGWSCIPSALCVKLLWEGKLISIMFSIFIF